MATLRTLQIYGTGSATANAAAQVTVPSQSIIKGVLVACRFDSVTDNGSCALELAKVATSQIATNGALDPFFQVDFYSNFVTSGLMKGSVNQFVPLHVPCRQGEIVYLHAFVSGTVTYYFTGILIY